MLRDDRSEDRITSREMRALELNTEYFGVSRLQLMESAGHSVALEIGSRFKPDQRVAIFSGLGGNGGDGFVTARHLSSKGFRVTVILAGKAKDMSHESALENWKALQFLRDSIIVHEIYDSSIIPEIIAEVAVDSLLGTGTRGRLRPPILQLVEKINRMKAFRVAVDVPTGIDADTGQVLGKAVKADLTLTFHRTKKGLEKAKDYVGKLIVKDIGLPEELEKLAGPGDVLLVPRPRPSKSHKGDFGRLLVIGGGPTFSGAPVLVAQAALRVGVDIVYVAAPAKTAHIISSMSPNLITVKLEGEHANPKNVSSLESFIETANAVILGPGLGLHPETGEFVSTIVDVIENAGKPLLLDADGLKAFAEFKRALKIPFVLTPHAKEYVALADRKLPDDLDEQVLQVKRTAAQLKTVILLKGPVDIVSDGKTHKLNFSGNPGMTVGGTGDVLSGIVGAFLAQKVDAFEAAVAGAFVNGAAGDFVFEDKGYHMVSTDLLDWIPRVLDDPMSHMKVRKTSAEKR